MLQVFIKGANEWHNLEKENNEHTMPFFKNKNKNNNEHIEVVVHKRKHTSDS